MAADSLSFVWLADELSESGVPVLCIHFPDGGPDDYADLVSILPIVTNIGLQIFVITNFCNLHHLQICY
jgi:hypothetical protein